MLRAIARFNLPDARAYLERVAQDPAHPKAGIAMDLLAFTGDAGAVRACIEEDLAHHERSPHAFFGRDVERLARWPAATIREALLARIDRGQHVDRWLWLLQWFMTDAYVLLFERLEVEGDPDAADVAHEFLRARRRRSILVHKRA